ncbi:MAG: hypothetical protein ACE5GT_14980, partial [Rhodospirillales bacterium]
MRTRNAACRAVLGLSVLAAVALAAAGVPWGAAGAEKLTPGKVFRDCPECPELVVVPAGIFVMGLNARSKRSKPPHR